MKLQLRSKQIFISLTGILFLVSCQDLSGPPPDEFDVPAEELVEPETKTKVDYVLRDIPSPVTITSALASSEAGYQASLVNSTSKSSSYTTNYSKAINLGIYLSDLCYAINYGESSAIGGYLKTIVSMASGMGMEKAFDEEFAKSIEENIDNIDTLNQIIDAGLDRADDFFISNERVATGSFMITGGYIETLYLTLNVIGDNKKGEKTKTLYSTAQILILAYENLEKLMAEYDEDDEYEELINQLTLLKEGFNEMGDISRLNLKKVNVLRPKVNEIREKMVQ